MCFHLLNCVELMFFCRVGRSSSVVTTRLLVIFFQELDSADHVPSQLFLILLNFLTQIFCEFLRCAALATIRVVAM